MLPRPATVLIAALNHVLRGNDWARQRLVPHAGRQASMNMPPFQFAFAISPLGEFEEIDSQSAVDVTITLPAAAPINLLDGIDRLMGQARVEGNAEFATELSFVFRNLRWDAEEDLARVVGDIAAHRLVQAAQGIIGGQKQAARHFFENVHEYLAFENSLLVSRAELDALSSDLSQLDISLSRLEHRIRQLA